MDWAGVPNNSKSDVIPCTWMLGPPSNPGRLDTVLPCAMGKKADWPPSFLTSPWAGLGRSGRTSVRLAPFGTQESRCDGNFPLLPFQCSEDDIDPRSCTGVSLMLLYPTQRWETKSAYGLADYPVRRWDAWLHHRRFWSG